MIKRLFSVGNMSDNEIKRHNTQVSELLKAYDKGCNSRVPVIIAFDEQFLLPLWGCTFRQYYQDVNVQIDVQLKNQKWIRENILHDAEMGLPAVWWVSPAGWMEENEFFGAEIVIQENDYAWGKPMDCSKAQLLKKLQNIDVRKRIQEYTFFRQYEEMKKNTEGMEFCGRPVNILINPVASTHGIFTKAAEVRGLDKICTDIYEDALFVKELLRTITDLTIQRIKTWQMLCDSDKTFPWDEPWGMADDSLTMISARCYEEFVLPCHQKLYAEMTKGKRCIHLCGHVQHLFKTLHEQLGITVFDGPGPHINLTQMINDCGERVEIHVELAHATLSSSFAEIETAVQKLISEDVKQRAKVMLVGYVPKNTPLKNIEFFYECGKKYGGIRYVRKERISNG